MFLGATLALFQKLTKSQPEGLTVWPMTGISASLDEEEEELFTFENLRSAPGSRHRKKRKGRGYAAGQGGTCGFGNRGQKARAGPGVTAGFEGGQNPLWRRTPKLRGRPMGPGHKRTIYQLVGLRQLEEAAEGATVKLDDRSGGKPVLFKVGGLKKNQTVTLPSNLTVKAHAFTATARAAIEAAGGKCVIIDKYSRDLDADGKVVAAPVGEKVAMAVFAGQSMAYYRESDVDTDSDAGTLPSDNGVEEVAMFAAVATRTVKVGKYKEPAPLSLTIPATKQAIVVQVNELLKASFLVFGFSVQGFTMAEIKGLRTQMPAGVKVQVVKNTLFRLACRGTGFEALDPLTMGAKAWVFVPEDCFQDAVKAYEKFLKDTKKPNPIVGGSLESQLLQDTQVVGLANLPTKKEQIETIARLIKGIQTKLAVSIKATPRKLAFAIKLATMPEDKEA